MALSRDLILIYASNASAGSFSALSFLAVPENRRKNIENRLQTLFRKTGKGKKLETADLTKHESSDQKALKEVLSAMQSSNVMKWRSASYTGKAGSRMGQLTTQLIDEMASLYPGCEFLIVYDPQQIQGSFLKSALRRSSQNVRLEEGHTAENVLLQCSLLMGQLASITAALPEDSGRETTEENEQLQSARQQAGKWSVLLEQLQTMEKYQNGWRRKNGELLLLDAKMPEEQKQVMERLLNQDPLLSSSRIWSSLSRTFLKKDSLLLLEKLFQNLSREEFSALSMNRLQKDPAWFENLLEKKTNPNPAPLLDQKRLQEEKERFADALHDETISSAAQLDERIDSLIKEICAHQAASEKKPGVRMDYYLSFSGDPQKNELQVLPAQNAALQSAWLRPVKRRTESSSAAGRLRAKDQLVRAALEQNDPLILSLNQKNDFAPLLDYLENQPEKKQVLHLSPRSFPALRRWLMKNNVFLDVHAEPCAESPLLEAAFLIHERLQDESLILPEPEIREETEESQAAQKRKNRVPYFADAALSAGLNREKLDLLCDPSVSVGVSRKLALAFEKGLDPEKVRILKEALDSESFQKELQLMILPYLFTARFVRLFQESAQDLSNEELDFVTLPGISFEKARALIEAFREGLSLDAVSHAVSRQNTLNTMKKKLETFKNDNNKNCSGNKKQETIKQKNTEVNTIWALPGREFRKEIDWKLRCALSPYQDQASEEDRPLLQAICYTELLKMINPV